MKQEIYKLVELFEGGKLVGVVEEYNPKKHEGFVLLHAVGIKEFGALPKAYEARLNGVRIPNKWDGKRDLSAEFFGE